MAYDVKNVFYLDTAMTIAATTAGATTSQLDLSAYIDPIARGRQKGTGLAVYKVHYDVSSVSDGSELVLLAEAGNFTCGLIAGAGLGNNATGVATPVGIANSPTTQNPLSVWGLHWWGPKSTIGNASTPSGSFTRTFLEPDKDVPYIIVRDNVCLVSEQGVNMTATATIAVRMECAIITLDQATLNQLLRTQTV